MLGGFGNELIFSVIRIGVILVVKGLMNAGGLPGVWRTDGLGQGL